MDHTTGFPDWRWLDPITGEWDGLRKMYIQYDPGTFSYSGEAHNYLAKVIAHLNGLTLKDLDSLFQQEIARPLGMINDKGLQPKTINEMLKIQSRIPPDQEKHFGVIKGWGLGFAVEPTDQDTIYSHSGENPGFLAFCAFSRKQKNGYVFFTNGDQGGILNMRLWVFLNEYKDSGLY